MGVYGAFWLPHRKKPGTLLDVWGSGDSGVDVSVLVPDSRSLLSKAKGLRLSDN